jgi:hypothetical protein
VFELLEMIKEKRKVLEGEAPLFIAVLGMLN